MVLTVSFVLSPVTGLCCHRRHADRSAQLDASVGASGPHDFAVRFSGALVWRTASVHRIPHPTFVTIAIRPSWSGAGRAEGAADLGKRATSSSCGTLARRANHLARRETCQVL